MWCIGDMDIAYRTCMYDVLDLYEEPYDPKRPVVGIDEKPKQLIEDSREGICMKPGKPRKYDYEYIRHGKVNIFVAVEPKGGKRFTRVTYRRTKKDFAKFMKYLVDEVYGDADLVRTVVDNLNTHNASSLYEMYDKEEAERILGRIEFHYTPKHASWLNVAETEIGVMDTECIGGRIKDIPLLKEEVRAWTKRRNKEKKKINWRFTKEKADKKLSKYYVD